jgi:hypothetical protein
MSAFVLSQILAGIAFALGVVSFQFRERRSVLLCLFFLTLFNSFHFLLLGRPGPAVLLILIGLRFLTAILSTNRAWMYLFLVASLGAFLVTFTSPLNLLALTAVLLGTYGSFQPDGRIMRIILMLGNALWLLHNLLASTPVATLMEASFLISNLLGYWRFYHPRGSTQRRASGVTYTAPRR